MTVRPCVLIPTYDNPLTIAAAVEGARAHCPDVIVVDDGSGDAARAAIDACDGIQVVRHPRNLGKGAALRSGWEAAAEAGFTHALAMDGDGQHVPDDLPALLEATRTAPDTLWIGARDLEAGGAGRGSRYGRLNSNVWTWIETGQWIPDTQSGLRVYPLEAVRALHLTCTGYDLEIEVLVKAAWRQTPIRSLPVRVRYWEGPDRVSHMKPFWDFLRIGRLNTRLVTQRICLPAPYLALRSSATFHALPFGRRLRESAVDLFVREPGSSARIALSVGLGLFIGLAPVWGFQVALTLLLCHTLNLSKPIAVVAAHISFPVLIPPILYASLVLGRLALGRDGPPAELDLARDDAVAWVVGSFLLATLVAIPGGLLTYLTVAWTRRARAS